MHATTTHNTDLLVEVRIRGLNGDVILGPEAFQASDSLSDVRSRLADHIPIGAKPACLFVGGVELTDVTLSEIAGEDILEMLAVFPKLQLSEKEREELLERMRLRGAYDFPRFSDDARADEVIVAEAVRFRPSNFIHAHPVVRADRNIVLNVVKMTGHLLRVAHETLRADREIVLAAVQQDALALDYADPSFYGDREIIVAAVKRRRPKGTSGWTSERYPWLAKTLARASCTLRSDIDIMKAAALRDGRLLALALGDARKDRKVIRAATKSYLRGQLWCIETAPREIQAHTKSMLRVRCLVEAYEDWTLACKNEESRVYAEWAQDCAEHFILKEEHIFAAHGEIVTPNYLGRKTPGPMITRRRPKCHARYRRQALA